MAGDTVWLDVLPSMAGFASSLLKGATADSATAGKASGAAFGKAFGSGANPNDMVEPLKKAAAAAEKLVATETQAIAKARAAQREATAKVIEAEDKLAKARTSGDSAKIAAAEERLAAARDRASGAASGVEAAEKRLSAASNLRKDSADKLSKAEADLAGKTDSAGKAAGTSATAFGRFKGELDDTTKKADGFGSKMGSTIKSLAGLAVAAVGITSIGAAFGDMVTEAREAEKVGKTTEQIIKATGGAAKVSADQLGAFVGNLSEKVGMDDELIQSGANLLLTFKNVRNEVGAGNDVFNRATAAAVDLSAAGFGSVESASKMLGKALNDPAAGISALGRAGVTFSEDQKKAIKQMVATGDVLGAQKLIMAEVESQVGGVAAANSTASERMAVAWGNFKEGLGTTLLPALDLIQNKIVNDVLPAASRLVGGIEPLWKLLTTGDYTGGLNEAFGWAEDSAPVDFILKVRDGALGLYDLIVKNDFSGALTKAFGWEEDTPLVAFLFSLRDAAVTVWDKLKETGAGIRDALQPIGQVLTDLQPSIRGAFGEALMWLADTALPTAKDAVTGLLDGLKGVVEWVVANREWLAPLAVSVGVLAGGFWALNAAQVAVAAIQGIMAAGGFIAWIQNLVTSTGLWAAAQSALNFVMSLNPIGVVIIAVAALVAGFIVAYNTSETFRNVVNGAWEGIKATALGVVNWFTGTAMPAVSRFIEGFAAGFNGLVDTLASWATKVKDAVMAPIRWLADNAINPLLEGIEKVAGFFGLKLALPRLSFADGGQMPQPGTVRASAFADGGMMPGYTPGRDVHKFYSPTGGLLELSGGEPVLRPEWGAVLGSNTIDAMNSAARSGGIAGVQSFLGSQALATGGRIIPNATQGFSGYDPKALAAMQAWAAATGLSWSMTGNGGARTYADQLRAWNLYQSGQGPLAANPATGGPHMIPAVAIDLSPRPGENAAARALLGQFGLGLTVPGEPWHVGYLGGRGGGQTSGGLIDPLALLKDAIGSIAKVKDAGVFGDVLNAIPGFLVDSAGKWLTEKATALFASPAGGTSSGGGDVKALAQSMAAARGWTGSQWSALDWIVSKESSWNPNAKNPTSTAYGLFQFLNSTWATVGASKTSDPAGQISAGLAYIAQRYGTPVGAQGFWQNNGWYDQGGWLDPGVTVATNRTGEQEAILTGGQWRDISSLARSGAAPQIDKDALREAVVAGVREGISGAELRLTGAVDTIGDAVAGRILLAYEGAV